MGKKIHIVFLHQLFLNSIVRVECKGRILTLNFTSIKIRRWYIRQFVLLVDSSILLVCFFYAPVEYIEIIFSLSPCPDKSTSGRLNIVDNLYIRLVFFVAHLFFFFFPSCLYINTDYVE